MSIVSRIGRATATAAAALACAVCLVLSLLAGMGLLYELRGAGWLTIGPKVRDALPLLQLAGFDAQPLGRVAVAWLAAGVVLGLALVRIGPLWRVALVGLLGVLLLLFASDAAFALARNLRLARVLGGRAPGGGTWVEAGLFTVGCCLPRAVALLRRPAGPAAAGPAAAGPAAAGQPALAPRVGASGRSA